MQLGIPFLLPTHFEQVSFLQLTQTKDLEAWINWAATGLLIGTMKWSVKWGFLYTSGGKFRFRGTILSVH